MISALAITVALVAPLAVATKYAADASWRSVPRLVAAGSGRHRAPRPRRFYLPTTPKDGPA